MTNSLRLALATASLTACAGTSSANILTNPGFEDITAWGYLFTLGDTCGYTTDASHTGTRSFLFGEADDVINLSQAVPFVNGQEYELSFWVLNYGVGNDFLSVSIFASDAPETTYLQGGVPTGLESWEQVNLNFTVPAVGDYYRFVFKGYDNNAAFYIDDVSLTAVPTSGTAGMLGIGGLAAVRRRR
jgi:hypothetical protein